MKKTTCILATAIILAQGISRLAAQAPLPDFHTKLTKDASPLPNGGQLQMSYATVADKILPSVVTIFSYSTEANQREMTADNLPPNQREFLYRFFGIPRGEDFGQDENEESNPFDRSPRRRGAPPQQQEQQKPRKAPEHRNGVGSGIIITSDGYIMTNNHVVEDASRIEVVVTISDVSKSYTAEIIGTDPATDVAIIKIDTTGLPPATLGDSSKLRVGDIVLAAGAPMELSRSISQGIVSALSRSNNGIIGSRTQAGYEDFIQTDASINPGNSGGPLVDGMGRVVGINTAILSKSGMNAGIGFAIPINMALRIGEDLLDDGEVQRGFLGINIQDIDETIARQYRVEQGSGAIIGFISPESPAEKAGLQVEDIVVSINGQRVDGSSRLRLIVSAMRPGTSVPIDVLRNGQRMTIQAVLEQLPEEALAAGGIRPGKGIKPKAPGKSGDGGPIELVKGVTIQTLNPALRERYDVPATTEGVIVTKLDPDSQAAATGLEEGDVITQINRQPATTTDAAKKLTTESAEKGEGGITLRLFRKGGMMLLMVKNE